MTDDSRVLRDRPAVTYIVSAYDRPQMLRCCLASLQVQTDPDFAVVVADNGPHQDEHGTVIKGLADRRFLHVSTPKFMPEGADCYRAANYLAPQLYGDWFCFPSDDSYYVPVFQEAMLSAAKANNWDLVYCDMVFDRREKHVGPGGRYHLINVQPTICHIDKTGFMVRREWFNRVGGFKSLAPVGAPDLADGRLIDELVAAGIRHGKVDEVLAVHN